MERWQLRPARDLGMPLGESLASVRREPGLLSAMGYRTWGLVAGFYLRLWHRLSVVGREHLPAQSPFVLIANHTSHLDALVLCALVPWPLRRNLFPLAAGDVFFETTARSALSAFLLNALPMRRARSGKHALDDLRARLLQDGTSLVLFPEGTRSATGTMAPFKAGLGMLVAGTPVPVVPCWLQGAFAAWPRQRRLPRPGRVTVRLGAPLRFHDMADDRAGWERVATTAQSAVAALAPAGTGEGR